jgi:hypothetical protein
MMDNHGYFCVLNLFIISQFVVFPNSVTINLVTQFFLIFFFLQLLKCSIVIVTR